MKAGALLGRLETLGLAARVGADPGVSLWQPTDKGREYLGRVAQ